MRFEDRRDAGRRLASILLDHRSEDLLVLGLARGGVPVAFEVARALDAPLDVFVARKIGAPGHPEFGVGAVAPGVRFIDGQAAARVGATDAQIDEIARAEEREMSRRYHAFRGVPTPPDVRGRRVLLVDDGLATGVTARAALRSLRARSPSYLSLAVPVAARASVDEMRAEGAQIVAAHMPDDLFAVGEWYDDFAQTDDGDVIALLQAARDARGRRS